MGFQNIPQGSKNSLSGMSLTHFTFYVKLPRFNKAGPLHCCSPHDPSSTGTPRPRLNYLLVRSIITFSTLGTPELSCRGPGTTWKPPNLFEMSSIPASTQDTSELDRRAARVIKELYLQEIKLKRLISFVNLPGLGALI